MRTYSSTKLYTEERFWFFAVCGVLLCVFAAYIYFLSASVVHVVMRKEIDHEIAMRSSEISVLEAEYIAAQHAVSEEIAVMKGYTIATEKTFIDRTPASLVLGSGPGG